MEFHSETIKKITAHENYPFGIHKLFKEMEKLESHAVSDVIHLGTGTKGAGGCLKKQYTGYCRAVQNSSISIFNINWGFKNVFQRNHLSTGFLYRPRDRVSFFPPKLMDDFNPISFCHGAHSRMQRFP